jgi:hypothetical protein
VRWNRGRRFFSGSRRLRRNERRMSGRSSVRGRCLRGSCRLDITRRSCRGCPRRFSELERPQALLYQFKILHDLLKFLFGIGDVAAPAPLDDPGIDQRPQSHHEHEKPSCTVHRLK